MAFEAFREDILVERRSQNTQGALNLLEISILMSYANG